MFDITQPAGFWEYATACWLLLMYVVPFFLAIANL